MADIELVIKISEDSYKATCNGYMLPPDVANVVQGIKNGTPLPKGHGRLIDASKLIYDCDCDGCEKICYCDNCIHRIVREREIQNAPTIIEADTESEDEE